MKKELDQILFKVQKPARYAGGEYNAVIKDKSRVGLRFALCFPDVYEVGMSHLGSKIIYGLLNDMDNVWCERVYAPWPDMADQLRRHNMKLYALESGDDLSEFDILGFSLQYELNFTNILNMLDLGSIPIRAKDRGDQWPLIIAGGPCVYNCEPVADFLDLIMIGESEESYPELLKLYTDFKQAGKGKAEFLKAAAQLRGIYVPSLYEVAYQPDGTVKQILPRDGAPETITKCVIEDMDKAYFPDRFIVPSTSIVFDRSMVELFRGCIRGCRFCQAGYTYRPIRAKRPETLIEQAKKLIESTGFEEISLSSLSTSDYTHLNELCDGLIPYCAGKMVSLSLPSLRADNFSIGLMERVQKVRKSGLTFAPEAGSQRLRDAINKNVREEDLLDACRIAFEGGWNNIKLYFMIGLPTETDSDLEGIAELAKKVIYTWRQSRAVKSRGVNVTISTSSFVPKPLTPFQWEAQDSIEELRRKQELLRSLLKIKNVTYNWHDSKTSFLEAVFARGDRRLSDVIETAWRSGCVFDSWDEYFNFEAWMNAFQVHGIDPHFYANRIRSDEETMPWDHISAGVTKAHLLSERNAARAGVLSPDCKASCAGCGALDLLSGGCCNV